MTEPQNDMFEDEPESPPAWVPALVDFHGPAECQAKLVEHLALARLEFGSIEKDRKGQYGNQTFNYSPLGTLTEATAKPLARHGIVCMQFITSCPTDSVKHRLTTMVAGHGARITTALDFKPTQDKGEGAYKGEWIKEYGKLCTYLCRYQYRTTFVLDSEPDADDAPAPERQPAPRREAPRPEAKPSAAPAAEPRPLAKAESRTADMERKLSTPVAVPDRKSEPPPPPAQGGEFADKDLVEQLVAMRSQLEMSRMELVDLCVKQWNIDPQQLKYSATVRRVMGHLQTILAERQGAA